MHLKVNIVSHSSLPLPSYQTAGSAGMDVYALLEKDIELAPLERKLIPTGLRLALPLGYEAQIRPRSGLALKQGITCLNSPGTIDSDYRGEIGVLLINFSNQPAIIKNGDRIAQIVISKYEQIEWNLVDSLDETKRGDGGFGSTG